MLFRFSSTCATFVAALLTTSLVFAQAPAPDPNISINQPAGVIVDADGVLRRQIYQDPNGALLQQRINDAKAALDPQIAARSKLRKVSLTRLEKAVAERLAKGQKPTEEMLCLAGLTRLRQVFVYPDSHDIVIAGPAEGWAKDPSGRLIGINSGRSILELQDLVVALRAYPSGSHQGPLIGCSIDPTQEGLARYNEFLRSLRPTPDQAQYIAEGLRSSIGLQTVRVEGVPADTHFAQVMVEADYRMKLIGIGLEQPPVKLVSYVARVSPAAANKNAMMRWYFMPDYKCVRTTEDRLAMELVGDGVKLVGANEVVASDGRRHATGESNGASAGFVAAFTKKYPDLAARSPVFAQLRNLIDMAVAAAFIQQNDYYAKAGWEMSVFGDERQFPVRTYQAPREVETAVNVVWKNNTLMTPLGGGVTVRAHEALDAQNLLADDEGKVQNLREELKVEGLADGQWWWD